MYYTVEKINVNDHEIDVLFYQAKTLHRPVVFEMHGGGFMFGSATVDAIACHRLRQELDINVVSIDYTLTTKTPYPTQLDEVYQTMLHFYNQAALYQVNKDKFLTYGYSAGANLATAVCLKAHQEAQFKVMLQVLFYPYLDLVKDPYQKPQIETSIEAKFMDNFRNKYRPSKEFDHPYITPLLANDEMLEKQPPAIIVVAEKDNVKFEGLDYAKLLTDHYVDVHVKVAKNKSHAFMEKYFSASRVVYTKYLEEKIFIWIKGLMKYYMDREF